MAEHSIATDRSAVSAYERQILAVEGHYHVSGVYCANADDADRQRRLVAERAVREDARREAWAARNGESPPLRVATWLLPRERQHVDAACGEDVRLSHFDDPDALRAAVACGRIDAVLVSVALVGQVTSAPVRAITRGFPACLVVGLVGETDERQALFGTLLLGRAGADAVVDARTPAGWAALRRGFDPSRLPDPFMRRALATVLADLGAAPARPPQIAEPSRDGGGDASVSDAAVGEGCVQFFRALFSPEVHTAKQLAARLGVLPSTLMSRFYRAGLPAPKRYVALARLAWAASLAEAPGVTIAAVANRIDASSPQSFGRTVRIVLGLTAQQFRGAYTGAAMLDHFRDLLVMPYRDTLRAFDPLAGDVRVLRLPTRESAAPGAGRAA